MEENRNRRKGLKNNKNKYTALLSMSAVAFIVIGISVFMDGEVLPKGSNAETLIEQTEHQAIKTLEPQIPKSSQSESSEYMMQLSLAIDSARQTEQVRVSDVERWASKTKASIDEVNQFANLESDFNEDEFQNSRLDEFNQSLDKLQNHLSELEAKQ